MFFGHLGHSVEAVPGIRTMTFSSLPSAHPQPSIFKDTHWSIYNGTHMLRSQGGVAYGSQKSLKIIMAVYRYTALDPSVYLKLASKNSFRFERC